MESQSMREHSSSSGRSFIARKFLGFISKRKRDEEKKRMDLFKAMRDSSVERLAAVIASARTEFGDRLHDLCSDAEGVLQRMLRESRPPGSRKVTLRERLLLADVEATTTSLSSAPIISEDRGSTVPTISEDRSSVPAILEDQSSAPVPAPTISEDLSSAPTLVEDRCTTSALEDQPRLQALLNLAVSSTSQQARDEPVEPAESNSSSIQQQQQQQVNSSGRRLLSALLFEERISDDPEQQQQQQHWVAFGVGSIHSRSGDLSRHRPNSSLGSMNYGSDPDREIERPQQQIGSSVDATPMRVSLMSLLREAEDGIILMNRQLLGDVDVDVEVSSSSAQAGEQQVCCVCMGRQKGAAFIPCGHTFCRRCCRELQFCRGNCPLCNKEIKDVLNLY